MSTDDPDVRCVTGFASWERSVGEIMVEYHEAGASPAISAAPTDQSFRGFSLWRAVVYGLALSGLAYAINTVQYANPERIANVFGQLAVGPLVFVVIGAFVNLFSSRKIGPSLAALMIIGGIVLAW